MPWKVHAPYVYTNFRMVGFGQTVHNGQLRLPGVGTAWRIVTCYVDIAGRVRVGVEAGFAGSILY